MKKLLFSLFIIATLHSFSQNANWGTGLPVNVTVNSSSLNLSVFDPVLNQTMTTSLSVGSSPTYVNNDGVVVGYGNNGYMKYAVYDLNLHAWKEDSDQLGASNTSATILNSNGVVVGFGSSGYMKYATYEYY